MSILLLENKTERNIKYDENDDKKNIVTFIYGDDKCNTYLGEFIKDNSSFDDYATIIIHGSIYGNTYQEKQTNNLFPDLEKYCKDQNKNLVVFSGNFSTASMNGNILTLSPGDMFENIKTYINEYNNGRANIMMLGYGKKWELNILLNILEKINIYREDYEDYNENESNFKNFKDKAGLNELKKIGIDCDELNFNEIDNLAKNIYEKIKDKSYE